MCLHNARTQSLRRASSVSYMAAAQKHRACNRPGRPFCDKACNRIAGSCDKPSLRQAYQRLQYSTQRLATWDCNRGPATKVCNRGGRTATNHYFGPHRHDVLAERSGAAGMLGRSTRSTYLLGPFGCICSDRNLSWVDGRKPQVQSPK